MLIQKIIQGEQKYLKFILTDKNTHLPVNLTNCTFSLKLRNNSSGGADINKVDADFDKTQASKGIVKVLFTSVDSSIVTNYIGQLTIVFSSGEIDKSDEFKLYVVKNI